MSLVNLRRLRARIKDHFWRKQCNRTYHRSLLKFMALREQPPEQDHRRSLHFSIILPVADPPPQFLCAALVSVEQQTYPAWQLCLCDDACQNTEVVKLLHGFHEKHPQQVCLIRQATRRGIAAATNAALELATGDLVCFLDHDDMLAPQALAWLALYSGKFPQAEVFYSDEDKIDEQDKRFDPFFKPDWSPHLLLGCNYIGHLTAVKRNLASAVGGLAPGFEGSQDHEYLLRLTEQASQVVHLDQVLYHWRAWSGSTARRFKAKPQAGESTRKAVSEALQRRGINATISPSLWHDRQHIHWPVPDGKVAIAVSALPPSSIRGHQLSSYPDHWRVIPAPWLTLGELTNWLQHRTEEFIIRINHAHTLPQAKNFGVLLGLAALEGVAFSGGLTLSPSGIILNAGWDYTGIWEGCFHPRWLGHYREEPLYQGLGLVEGEVSVPNLNFFCCRRTALLELLQPFPKHGPIAIGLRDAALSAAQQGLRSIQTPFACKLSDLNTQTLQSLNASVPSSAGDHVFPIYTSPHFLRLTGKELLAEGYH